MNATLWIIQLLLAVVFAATGTAKVSRPRLALAGGMHWVADATDAQVKGVGVLEMLAAIGLVVPPAPRGAAKSRRQRGAASSGSDGRSGTGRPLPLLRELQNHGAF